MSLSNKNLHMYMLLCLYVLLWQSTTAGEPCVRTETILSFSMIILSRLDITVQVEATTLLCSFTTIKWGFLPFCVRYQSDGGYSFIPFV